MKKLSKVLCGILGVAFLATGCATVGNIKNSESEIVYNGNIASVVDGYLYYGNSFADYESFTNDSSYKTSAKLSYLARLNTNIAIAAKSKDYSPSNIETVEKEVVGHNKSFMFVLGQYVYYTTPKREQSENDSGKLEYNFACSKIYRSKLNGDSKKAVYTTDDEIKQIEVLKAGGKYYLVFLAGEKLVKIELGSKLKTTTIATGVGSVALPKTYEKNKEQSTLDWNGYIYYTTTRKVDDNTDITGSVVSKVSVTGGKAAQVGFIQGKTISFVGRERDVAFYTLDSKTYKLDTNVSGQIALNSDAYLFYNSEISNINLIASNVSEKGYLFKAGDDIVYKTTNGDSAVLRFENGSTSISTIMFVNGRTIYLQTAEGIFCKDIGSVTITNGVAQTLEADVVVKMLDIKTGLYAFDKQYVYFYAHLEDVDGDEGTEIDDYYYLYRSRVGSGSYELLSYTYRTSRHS
ncbi:MAG: hypothetical protein IJ817_02920 [Clostridia bacterium]|nr:hypothetical protein [Clostridia bacterium]